MTLRELVAASYALCVEEMRSVGMLFEEARARLLNAAEDVGMFDRAKQRQAQQQTLEAFSHAGMPIGRATRKEPA